VIEPTVQNHYPDFTYHKRAFDLDAKIAIDVKTTYRMNDDDRFNYTLGGYTNWTPPRTRSLPAG
jgi:hypothetical protein